MKKEEINTLLKDSPDIGVRFLYSKNWTDRVRTFLHEPLASKLSPRSESSGHKEDIPHVSTWELDLWRGFYAGPDGKHWGATSVIAAKLGIRATHSILQNINSRQSMQIYSRREVTGYCFEDIARELENYQAAPQVEKKDEWEGFVEIGGQHVGPIKTIANRLGVDEGTVRDWLTEDIKLFGVEIRDTYNRKTTGYPIEVFAQRARNLKERPEAI